MDAIKHTPGPWVAAFAPDLMATLIGTEDRSTAFARMESHAGEPDAETQKANARLIVAAPDLLSVAVECLELMKLAKSLCSCRADDDYVWGIEDRLEAALNKAGVSF